MSILTELVVATRSLWNQRGLSLVAVLTLGVGIGANTAVFSVVEAMYNFPIPMASPERVVFLFADNPEQNILQNPTSVDDFLDWTSGSNAFIQTAATSFRSYNLSGHGDPIRVQAVQASGDFFELAGAGMSHGRPFGRDEARPGADKVLVLSHGFWQRQFAADPTVVGRKILLDGEPHLVLGITAKDFFFPTRLTGVYTPLVLESGRVSRSSRTVLALGRLKDGVTTETASGELESIAARLATEFPADNKNWTASVVTIRDNLLSGAALALLLLYGSITCVFLIACANVANLLLARASIRQKEMALRSALGAGRLRLIRQLLTESVLLSILGGVIGLLLGVWGMNVLRGMLAPDPNIGFIAADIELNLPMLTHVFAISGLGALLFGLAPALKTSRVQLSRAMNDAGRGSESSGRHRLRSVLIISEVSMAIALLGTSGVLLRAVDSVYGADPGFNPSGVLTMQLALDERNYPEDRDTRQFYQNAIDELSSRQEVKTSAATTQLPLTVFPGAQVPPVWIEGTTAPTDENLPTALNSVITEGFLPTLEISLQQGRNFESTDRDDQRGVAIVNEEFSQRYLDSQALGRRIRLSPDSQSPWLTIVGVAANIQTTAHSIRNANPLQPQVYTPMNQQPQRAMTLIVRTRSDPTAFAQTGRAVLRSIDETQPVTQLQSMNDAITRIDTQNRFFAKVLSTLSTIALLLAAIGIYGIVTFSVNQRYREIGVRMALGATPRAIISLVVRHGAALTLAGLAIGIVVAIGLVRLLSSQLETLAATGASGPLTYLGVSLVLLVVAQLASYVPARRAVGLDPVQALRSDR